ncbi:MAG TPA: hypothetical protein P5311_02950 [Candidatus Dojkabacteria bacterium]|nr:hypothetical protein [Candidatus Dojkabacteria bacterium]
MKNNDKRQSKQMLKKIGKKKVAIIIFAFLVIVGLGFVLFFINREHRRLSIYRDVTFVNPDQAIIFWKTEDETIGYVKYGEKKHNRENIELQTTSQEGETHVVFLDNIPPEGLYISIHNESDSFLILPEILKIQFNEEDLPYE